MPPPLGGGVYLFGGVDVNEGDVEEENERVTCWGLIRVRASSGMGARRVKNK